MENNKIAILPENISSKIAAGEVIERPSSVIRELIDNSIDANATEIIIKLVDGGIKLIVITDNGSGINKDDFDLILKKHATSKLYQIDDLNNIKTLGFRGEALYSIQTVSQFTIISNTDDTGTKNGNRLSNFGDEKFKPISVGAIKGTKIEVANLFYNLPARKKFLKSNNIELNSVKQIVTLKALSHLNVSFKLYNNDKLIFLTNGDNNFENAFFSIYKNENKFAICKYEEKLSNSMDIIIYHSQPDIFFDNRRFQELFVNKRNVSVSFFYSAVNGGIKNFVSPNRYPLIFFFINIDPTLIDVNIHPAKKEVKFFNQSDIFFTIQQSIIKAFSNVIKRDLIDFNLNKYNTNKENNDDFILFEEKDSKENSITITINDKDIKEPNIRNQEMYSKNNDGVYTQEMDTYQKTYNYNNYYTNENKNYKILGVAYFTYIIVEFEDKIVLIDQHAADEALRYIEKRSNYQLYNRNVKLLIPKIVEIDKWDNETEERIEYLNKNNFLIETRDENTIVIKEMPEMFATKNNTSEIEIIIGFLEKKGTIDSFIVNDILIESSCKNAIKKGDMIYQKDLEDLVKRYLAADIKNCPHGRPSHFEINRDGLEKIFQRKK